VTSHLSLPPQIVVLATYRPCELKEPGSTPNIMTAIILAWDYFHKIRTWNL